MLRQPLFRLIKNDRGIAAIETALILPVFILLLVGSVEIYQLFRAQTLVNKAAQEIAHSLSLQKEVVGDGDCKTTSSLCVYETVAQQLTHPLDFATHGLLSIQMFTSRENQSGNTVWQDERVWSPVSYGNTSLHRKIPARGPFNPERANESILIVELAYELAQLKLTGRLYGTLTGSSMIVGRSVMRIANTALLDKEPDDT